MLLTSKKRLNLQASSIFHLMDLRNSKNSDEKLTFYIQRFQPAFPAGISSKRGIRVFLKGSEVILGRSLNVQVPIFSGRISQRHALLKKTRNSWSIQDEKSGKGVWVNGERLSPLQAKELLIGDIISLGAPDQSGYMYEFSSIPVMEEKSTQSSPIIFVDEDPKLPADKPEVNLLERFENLMESELSCSICRELFVQATTLGCSHTFCQQCIAQWNRKKKECPVCRAKIKSIARTLVLDNFIERMVENLSPDIKTRRLNLLKEKGATSSASEGKQSAPVNEVPPVAIQSTLSRVPTSENIHLSPGILPVLVQTFPNRPDSAVRLMTVGDQRMFQLIQTRTPPSEQHAPVIPNVLRPETRIRRGGFRLVIPSSRVERGVTTSDVPPRTPLQESRVNASVTQTTGAVATSTADLIRAASSSGNTSPSLGSGRQLRSDTEPMEIDD